MSDETPCYIGINAKGQCRAACVDDNDASQARRKDTAKTIAEWIKSGLTIERVTVEEARKRLAEGFADPSK